MTIGQKAFIIQFTDHLHYNTSERKTGRKAGKTRNLKKFNEALKADKALAAKFGTEAKRLISEKLMANDTDAFVKAAKTVGFEVTLADLEKAKAERQELDQDELDAITGGRDDVAPAKEVYPPEWLKVQACDGFFWAEDLQ